MNIKRYIVFRNKKTNHPMLKVKETILPPHLMPITQVKTVFWQAIRTKHAMSL